MSAPLENLLTVGKGKAKWGKEENEADKILVRSTLLKCII